MPVTADVLTIGHSTHAWERFSDLLRGAGATALADVRSVPRSRHSPHFDRHELAARLRSEGIRYVFLGRELGGRPASPALFTGGVADYDKMAAAADFRSGLDRVAEGARRFRVCLMCSEQDPLDCHRCLLVGRRLDERGLSVAHLLADGGAVAQDEIEERLLEMAGIADDDLFAPRMERLERAYRDRGRRVAFVEPPVAG